MKKFLSYLIVGVIVAAGLLRYSLEFESAQDTAMRQIAKLAAQRQASGAAMPDSLQAFVCGSASPLGASSDRAQACIAIITPQHFFIVDSGAGSTANLTQARMPFKRLQGIFLTHFHSDHIAEIPEVNLASWVLGRPFPLTIYGPKGVKTVVSGINETYSLDSSYRVAHHGTELLAPELGVLTAKTIKPGIILEDGDLTVTAYTADHAPISPAVGYRFDYRGRSIVISGDSNVTDATKAISKDADLLLHDALSVPMVSAMAAAFEAAGINRMSKIATDVMDYHASTDSLLTLDSNVDMVAYYHLVPTPGNLVMEQFFKRGLPENYVIATDKMIFELPSGTNEINIIEP